jgi:hypothetical protein
VDGLQHWSPTNTLCKELEEKGKSGVNDSGEVIFLLLLLSIIELARWLGRGW